MGSNPSSLVLITIRSTEPKSDALFLNTLFLNEANIQLQYHENGQTVVLKDGNTIGESIQTITIYVLADPESKRRKDDHNIIDYHFATMTATIDTIQRVQQQCTDNTSIISGTVDTILIGNHHRINKICLPSGSSFLYMIPPSLLLSSNAADIAELGRTLVTPPQSSPIESNFDFCNETKRSNNGTIVACDRGAGNTKLMDSAYGDDPSIDEVKTVTTTATSRIAIAPTPKLPNFPTLNVKSLQNDGTYGNFPLNSQQPIDIETVLFKGQIIMIVRPPNNPDIEDPYWNEKVFSRKKRRLVIQIQGKFKYEPKGIVFAGAQISDPMKLGLITRGLCSVLLKIVENFNTNIHFSFGSTCNNNDTNTNANKNDEKPHIVAPAYTFFDSFVQTPSHDVPPSIMEIFVEDSNEASKRKKSPTTFQWNTKDTYSFSFYSMYIDLPSWQLVGIPARGDLSLKTFWGNSLLNICMYEHTGSSPKYHYQDDLKYAFAIQSKFYSGKNDYDADVDNRSENLSDGDSDDANKSNVIQWSEGQNTRGAILREQKTIVATKLSSPAVQQGGDSNNSEEVDLSQFTTAILSPERLASSSSTEDDDDNESFITTMHENYDNDELFFFDALDESSQDINNDDTEKCRTQMTSENRIHFALQLLMAIDDACPARIDVCSSRGGHYIKSYVINWDNTSSIIPEKACLDFVRQANSIVPHTIKATFSPRMSSAESLRRAVGMIISQKPCQTGITGNKLKSLVASSSSKMTLDELFRNNKRSRQLALPDRNLDRIMLSSNVARAISDRHWVEEVALLSSKSISFVTPGKLKLQFCIPLSNIMKAEILDPQLCPRFLGFHFFALQTFGRTHYVMVSSNDERSTWIEAIVGILKKLKGNDGNIVSDDASSIASMMAPDIDNPADEFLHNSSMWQCKNRRILNCGQFMFLQKPITPTTLRASFDPLTLVENALRKCLDPKENLADDYEQRRLFLDSTAELKSVTLHGLTEDAKLAFFLNLYHVMITHSYLVLGPPNSSLKWISYFNSIAYEVGDDIFSLTELEHCIIRAKMSYPSHFISRFILPKSRFRIAMEKADFRINFALNCGSLSNPPNVIVYSPDCLKKQLDKASKLYLARVTSTRTSRDIEIRLPKMCQWFYEDFGSSDESLLGKIEPFLPKSLRKELQGDGTFEASSCHVRYHFYSFECRPLSLVEETSINS